MKKQGDSLRFDFNIVSIKGLKCKKNPTSLLFNPLNVSDDQIKGYDKIFILDHKEKTFSRLLSRIKPVEKKTVIRDFLTKSQRKRKIVVEDFFVKFQNEKKKFWKLNGFKCQK